MIDKLGAIIISVIILTMFGVVCSLVLTKSLPEGSETQSNLIVGALITLSGAVVTYWLGSTASGGRKDATIAEQGKMLASAAPPSQPVLAAATVAIAANTAATDANTEAQKS